MKTGIDEINLLRQKVLAGEDLTPEETRTALDYLRADRKGVGGEKVTGKVTGKGKSKAAPIDLKTLFGD